MTGINGRSYRILSKRCISWGAVLVIGVISVAISLGVFSSQAFAEEKESEISLEAPSFPATKGTGFLEEEAGISTYTNVGETIDLGLARNAFRSIEYETDEYIIGSVPLPDYPETEDVHSYVHIDGWVVTYYLRKEVVAKILDWEGFGPDEVITGTKLQDGIFVVCDAAGVPIGDIKYYDFKYPNANKMMIIVDALWTYGEDTLNIMLPSDFVFYERSFSHYVRGGGSTNSSLYIDGQEISYLHVTGTHYGLISPTLLSPGVFHTVKVTNTSYNLDAFDAIILVYREP